MDESQWLTFVHPDPMLRFLGEKCSQRKLRALHVACCRRIEHLITKQDARRLLNLAEESLDRPIHDVDLPNLVNRVGYLGFKEIDGKEPECIDEIEYEVNGAIADIFRFPTFTLNQCACALADAATGNKVHRTKSHPSSEWEKAAKDESAVQASLVREIFGNPFREIFANPCWPAEASRLAQALYDGQPCRDHLRDSLLEAGFSDLASHFAQPKQIHPKGCWVVDLILDKKELGHNYVKWWSG